MIKPTIGRIVWYWPLTSPGTTRSTDDQPLAAIVCHVHSDNCVNLAVFDESGVVQNKTSVFLYQGEGDKPDQFYCEWMPYQIGQAKKNAP